MSILIFIIISYNVINFISFFIIIVYISNYKFLNKNNYYYLVYSNIKNKSLVIIPFIYLTCSFLKNIKYIYFKIIFIIENLNYCIIYLKAISFINWILILIIITIINLFIYFIFKNNQIIKLFSELYLKNKFLFSFLNSKIFKIFNSKLKKSTVIIKLNNIQILKIIKFIKNLFLIIFKINFLIDINFKTFFGFKLEFLKLFEEINNTSSSEEDNDLQEIISSLTFDNFYNVSKIEQINYIHNKMINKGIDPNQPLTDWFISATLKNTNCTQIEVDSYIELNLNLILKNQREAQLNTHAFERVKPFLIHKTNQEPNTFPNVIPISNIMSEYEIQEFIDAIDKEKDNFQKTGKINDNSKNILSSNEFENDT